MIQNLININYNLQSQSQSQKIKGYDLPAQISFKAKTNNSPKLNKPITKDITQFKTNTLEGINNTLIEKYGINSDIKNLTLAKKLIKPIDEFCKLNGNNKIFSGLNIKTSGKLHENASAIAKFNAYKNEFSLIFNQKYDWANIDKITKEKYANAEISSDNPNYIFYQNLGRFLNFKNNPHAYRLCVESVFEEDALCEIAKISEPKGLNDFNADYIATKMCGVPYPPNLDIVFLECVGNTSLKYPKTEPLKFEEGTIHNFKSMHKAIKYLKNNYNINAEFINLQQANDFVGAVEDIIKLTKNDKCFSGLVIKVDPDEFDDLSAKALMDWDEKTNDSELYINPAIDWTIHRKLSQRDYDVGYHPTNRTKDTFIHELAHYLDFKGNPLKFAAEHDRFKSGKTKLSEYGKSVLGKVGIYATENYAEFCAEYICARLAGLEYPYMVNKVFEEKWNGPKLYFNKK